MPIASHAFPMGRAPGAAADAKRHAGSSGMVRLWVVVVQQSTHLAISAKRLGLQRSMAPLRDPGLH